MALFKKSAEEVLKFFNQLSDEEKAKVLDGIQKPAEETKEQVAEAEEDVAEKGADEQTEKDRVDESVGEQEKLDGNEDSQTAEDRVDESEGETAEEEELEDDPAATPDSEQPAAEVATEEDKQPAPADGAMENPKDEVHEALNARIAALEETLQRVLEKLDNQDFGGIRANSTEKVEDDALSEDDRIMRSYYGNSYRR
nr:MAG TPA: hypothetical protein [Caudoviricetes sp.]